MSDGPISAQPREIESGLKFRLPVYEGPLDLLLHLLKKNELEPHEVAASVITEQFVAYVELLDSLNLDVAGEYLVMAATLLLIKSFSLLPHPELAGNEEAEELKRDLVARLMEYQRYREAAAKLGDRPILGRDVFAAPGEQLAESAAEPSGPYQVSVFDLVEAMSAVLKRIAEQAPRELKAIDVPVASCIPRVLGALASRERVAFTELFEGQAGRSLMIATFLALLELVRRGEVRAWQEVRFGPIYLSRGIPHPALAR